MDRTLIELPLFLPFLMNPDGTHLMDRIAAESSLCPMFVAVVRNNADV
jgi:hypothetical protein